VLDDIEAFGHAGQAFEPCNEMHWDCAATTAGASSETNNAFFAAVRVCVRLDCSLPLRPCLDGTAAVCRVEAIAMALSVIGIRLLTR
jgi:hypothetical protein